MMYCSGARAPGEGSDDHARKLSAIFTHNLALLGNRVGFSSAIGSDALGEIALQFLRDSGTDVSGARNLPAS